MKPAKRASSASKKYPPGSFIGKLRKRRIIETFAAFAGGGVVIVEFAHHILVNHYHFPHQTVDVCIVTLVAALICTLTWRWFGGIKKPRKIKVELIFIPLVILITAFFDIRLIQQTGEPEAEAISETRWKNSIAVLPFTNISADKGQEYFCDGLTEELINRLSNIRELKVPARTSVFAFKGEKIDIREVGEKLNVDKVLEGSVRKTEDRIRITAQLINVADGYHLWSEKYDRKLDDVFAIQDEISLAIADKLKVSLFGKEKENLVKRYTENLEAYNLYLQGCYFLNKRTEESMKKAIEYFEKAIEKDPDYALSYAKLADSYTLLDAYTSFSSKEAYPKAEEAALKALEIDNTLAEAHTSLAYIKMRYDWDWESAEKEFRQAIELNPSYSIAHHWYGLYLKGMARFDESLEEIKKAHELDPLDLPINRSLGMAFYSSRQYDKAIEVLKRTIEMDPNFGFTHQFLGQVYFQKSRYEEALTEFQKGRDIPGGFKQRSEAWIGITYVRMDKREEAHEVLDGLIEQSKQAYDPIALAALSFALGKKDLGFKWLEKGYEDRNIWPWILRDDALFGSVHSDPHFKTLLKKMHLE